MNDTRQHMTWASRLRFVMRIVGITAVLAAAAGAIYLSTIMSEPDASTVMSALRGGLGAKALLAAWLAVGGAVAVLLALAVELLTTLTGGASSVEAGVNSFAQIILACGVLIAINVFAFEHGRDFDLTRNREFTLPADVVSKLKKLSSETTIVVLQQHKTFGRLSEKPDRFDYAAERKVVEKVLDTVDLFRKIGPQFKVVVLDVEEDQYDKKLDELTKNNAPLKAAIQAAPENSIFFSAGGRVQRMAFNEFYLLDKSESKQGKGNLVLEPQGLQGIVDRILAIEEKRPKVALLSMHRVLSSEAGEGQEVLSLAGMRKSLEANGFEVVDLILKKNHRSNEQFDGDPAASSLDETRLQETEEEFADVNTSIRTDQADLKKLREIQKRCDDVKAEPMKKRIAVYRELLRLSGQQLPRELTEAQENEVERQVLAGVAEQTSQAEQQAEDHLQERNDLEKKLEDLRGQERAVEDRWLDDVKAKFTRLLEDCDLVIVPRITILNAPNEERIPYGVQKMKDVHIEVLKEFVKAGKPMLVCTGPINEADEDQPPPAVLDELDTMLRDRGIELGKQTILFDMEKKAFSGRTAGKLLGSSDVPPVSFEPPADRPKDKPLNPLDRCMLAVQRSIDEKLNIKLRAPRPIYYVEPDPREPLPYIAEFMWSAPNSWNEMFPFPRYRTVRTPAGIASEPEYIPHFDPTKGKEGKGNDDERRGPFPIGVAIESYPPPSWSAPSADSFEFSNGSLVRKKNDSGETSKRRLSRLVVIGQGGAFAGTALRPATERLLLNTCNWLLMRDDRLPRTDEAAWRYPRLDMDAGAKRMWHWGTFAGLPAFFIGLGVVVLMIRGIR